MVWSMPSPNDIPILRPKPRALFHYTCEHTRKTVGQNGLIRPANQLMDPHVLAEGSDVSQLLTSVSWWSTHGDIGKHNAHLVGLNNPDFRCERWAYRYRAVHNEVERMVPWEVEQLAWPEHIAEAVNSWHGAEPLSWYVSTKPVLALYSPIKVGGWAGLVSS